MAGDVQLGGRAARGAFFVAFSTYANILVTLVSVPILARLLPPDDFGVVAMGLVLISFLNRLRSVGLQQALMHRQEDVPQAAATHLTMQTGLSLLVLALATGTWPLWSRLYGDVTAAVVVALAAADLLEGWGSTYRVLLDKELLFRRTALVEAGSAVVGSGVAIAGALLGWGVWSLVLREGGRQVCSAVGYWLLSPFRPRFALDLDLARWFLRYGPFWYLFLASLSTLLLLQFDDFVVGTLTGMAALGFYGRAYDISTIPTGAFTHVISRVAFPTYAKLQGQRERLSQTYALVLGIIARLAIPAAFLIVVAAEETVTVFLGPSWLPASFLLQLLVVYALLRPAFDDAGALLSAIGKPQLAATVLNIQAVSMLVLTPPMVYFFKAVGAALAVDVMMLIGVVLMFYHVNRLVDVPWRETLLPPVLAGVVGAGVARWALGQWPVENVVASLGAKLVLMGTIYLGLTWAMEGWRLWRQGRYLLEALRQG